MAGTREGGLKTVVANRERHGDDFYQRIGAKGGSAPCKYPKGFAANRDLARVAGAKGGRNRHKTQKTDGFPNYGTCRSCTCTERTLVGYGFCYACMPLNEDGSQDLVFAKSKSDMLAEFES